MLRVLQSRDSMFQAIKRLYSGYGNKIQMPMGGYSTLLVSYAVLLRRALRYLGQTGALDRFQPTVWDFLLLALANQKLAILLTREWVTSPIRAPFTRFKEIARGGELDEESRGVGLRAAIGDLLCCPYCAGVWLGTGMLYAYTAWPRQTRWVASILVVVNLTDHLHGFSERLEQSEVFSKAA